jgi:hypothetical protein
VNGEWRPAASQTSCAAPGRGRSGTAPLALLLLLALACRPSASTENEPPAAPPAPSVSASSAESLHSPPQLATPPPASEWTAGIVDRPRPVGLPAILKSIGAVTQDHGERVVFEFEGDHVPGYHLEYVDHPVRQCASGAVVEIAGDAWLQVRLSPAQAHTEDGQPTLSQRKWNPGLGIVREIASTCDFEADVTWVLGVAAPNRYRVSELANPPRLVVDILH